MTPQRATHILLPAILGAASCTPSQEPVHVALNVELDASALVPTTNDMGWTIELTTARLAAKDVQFWHIDGEGHCKAPRESRAIIAIPT